MNASYAWLREFVPVELSPTQLREILTARCATVDDLVPLRTDLADIVVARVVEAARHPNSDHLWVTRVDAGGAEPLDVVCGAPNVRAGALYPFAPVGTVMPGGMRIERRKIRGESSSGMLCSARELGLGEDHEGILELNLDAEPGTPLLSVLPVGDTRLVVDVTPNRPDLLSHLGLAREVAAATGRELRMPEFSGAGATSSTATSGDRDGRAGSVSVTLEDADGAPRYAGVVIRGVRVAPSPTWLVERIEAVGSRPINNVVDATNYLLHELGQPMHAFDLRRLSGNSIVIRRAREGERITTLDGVERTLTPNMTVIADAERPQAIAGVMGGADSEVTADTTDIFLEVATFDPRRTRATRRALGIATDASYRFERGVDPELPPAALGRAVRLITALAGGEVEGSPLDLHPVPQPQPRIVLRVARVTRVLGDRLPASWIAGLLRSVGFVADVVPGTEMLTGSEEIFVQVPSWRRDVELEADLIEEVARLHGYDSFPNELRPYRPGTVPDAPLWALTRRVRETLISAGLLEVRPMPFVQGAAEGYVRVVNPLAETEGCLRVSLLETLARRAEYNLAHMQRNVRLFEIGAAFTAGTDDLPMEQLRVALLVLGERRPPHFTEPRPPLFDAWDAKGLAELVARAAFPGEPVFLHAGSGDLLWQLSLGQAITVPGSVVVGGQVVGQVRQVPLDAPVWAAPAFGVELVLGEVDARPVAPPGHSAISAHEQPPLAAGASRPVSFRPLPSTPAAEFDLALVVPAHVPAAQVETVIRSAAGDLLEKLALFDEYRGAGVPADARSLAWRLTFRHPERTLREREIEGRREKLLRALENELGIRQRTA